MYIHIYIYVYTLTYLAPCLNQHMSKAIANLKPHGVCSKHFTVFPKAVDKVSVVEFCSARALQQLGEAENDYNLAWAQGLGFRVEYYWGLNMGWL